MFVKLFGTVLYSTVWAEDSDTRVVWITMLAMSDQHGYVGASVPGLANVARVSIEATERALAKFLAPDPYSRSREHDGRRVAEASGGWVLLNYSKYREMRDKEKRRDQYRESKRRARAAERCERSAGGADENLPPDEAYTDEERVQQYPQNCDG